MSTVSIVIPGRNVEAYLNRTLSAAVKLKDTESKDKLVLNEIVFVDNNSTDRSLEIAKKYDIIVLSCVTPGPSAARNLGWKATKSDYVWFVDADCELNAAALEVLASTILEQGADAVSGGYLNSSTDSTLAEVIQAEFEYRYAKMNGLVTYATTCNLLCSRKLLVDINGFRENIICVEDGDFIFRALELNKKILFNPNSRIPHQHATNLLKYLKKQNEHGYWAIDLYTKHPARSLGHSYSSFLDHIQPFIILLFIIILPFSYSKSLFFLLLFILAQLPIFLFIYRRISLQNALYFVILSFLRTISRLLGICSGLLSKISCKS